MLPREAQELRLEPGCCTLSSPPPSADLELQGLWGGGGGGRRAWWGGHVSREAPPCRHKLCFQMARETEAQNGQAALLVFIRQSRGDGAWGEPPAEH